MFTHVFVGTDDLKSSKQFYDAALGALGHREGQLIEAVGRVMYMTRHGTFGVTLPINGEEATHANGGTIGFKADSPEAVDAFHRAGVAAGGEAIEDAPGIRAMPFGQLYLAYLRDPAGNKVCAMHTMG